MSSGGAITTKDELAEAAERNRIPLNAIVYKDQLYRVPIKNGGYIINLANQADNNGGTHWTAMWIEGNKAVYFDPFGIAPPQAVEQYVGRHETMFLTKQIQNVFSDICGYYVLFFLYYMNTNRARMPVFHRATSFSDLFSSDPKDNRRLLEYYLKPVL